MLTDKLTIITGAGRGIGREIAIQFAVAGSDICIGDIDYEQAKETGREIENLGRNVLVVDCDTSDYLQAEQLIKRATERFNRIDILINNAACVKKTPFLEYSPEEWNRTIDVCLNGYFYCGQLGAKAMIARKTEKGKIINIASVVGFVAHGGLTAYSAAKAAVLAMTKLMSHELKKYDLSVNAVVPSMTDTPLMKGVLEKMGDGKGPMLPRTAVSTAEDVAKVVLKIATDKENLLNGNIINVGSGILGE